jgi:hypothetical protein
MSSLSILPPRLFLQSRSYARPPKPSITSIDFFAGTFATAMGYRVTTRVDGAARQTYHLGMRAGLIAALAGLSCVGRIGSAPEPPATAPPPGANPTAPAPTTAETYPGPGWTRRLTRTEYDNTVRDLLGEEGRPGSSFLPEEMRLGFDNNAAVLTVPAALAEEHLAAAESVAAGALERLGLAGLAPCSAIAADDACARRFIRDFGRRAWRRPLEPDDEARLHEVFTVGAERGGFAGGVRLVITALLEGAPFLYRVELGTTVVGRSDLLRPTSWEMASRLSYLFTGSMPDAELLAAAGADALVTPAQIEAQARRLVELPRAVTAAESFFRQWLRLQKAERPTKETLVFPRWHDTKGPMFREELRLFVNEVFWRRERSLDAFFYATDSFVNETTAEFYDVPFPGGEGFVPAALDPAIRGGILTRVGLLAALAHTDQTSPTARGKFVREQLLCQFPPSPPPDADISVPSPDRSSTTRERLTAHMGKQACQACHGLMDPIGFGLEQFDGVGLWRDTENDKPVDARGELAATDVDGPFTGAAELQRKLASSAQVRGCVARQWFRYAFGREEETRDARTLQALVAALDRSGGNLHQFLVALTRTDAFLYLKCTAERCPEVAP